MIAGVVAVVVAGHALIAQCSGNACPNPCTNCAFQPQSGTDPSAAEYQDLFRTIAQRQGAADLPHIGNLESGANRASSAAEFPCTLMPAVGSVESSITEFCGGNGLTVISFDCGFGVMQVTSGAASYPGIQSRADINIAAGADILASKWNDNADFGGEFGDSDPSFLESWYFAVWAFNGFVYGNNPNNPNFPASRPPFHGPSSLSRGSYPYQELVWGFLEFPLLKDGTSMWTSIPVTYPNRADIPNQSGLFSVAIPLPQPAHNDSCVEQCPPSGCPPQDQRVLFLDDQDSTFTIDGDTQAHATGGFRDHFFSAAVSATATVHAHYQGTAPSSGTFDFAGFIPLDPATASGFHIVVHARGAAQTFSLDENVNGGFFQSLGQVALQQGQTVTVDVDNASDDADTTHRVGIDAFQLTWQGDGAAAVGDACADDVDCAGDALCVSNACADGCEVAGCGASSSCDTASGACVAAVGEGEGEGGGGEGEGSGAEGEGSAAEGEGEGGRVIAVPTVSPGCNCGSASAADAGALAATLLWLVGLPRRRRR